MTAPEIAAEIRHELTPKTLDLSGASVGEYFRSEQRHVEGIREAHALQAITDPDALVEAWGLGAGAALVLCLVPSRGARRDRTLFVLNSAPKMALSIQNGWRLRGTWEPTQPTEMFAEFVARFGFALRVGTLEPQLFIARAVVPAGVGVVGAAGAPDTAAVVFSIHVDKASGDQTISCAYGIRSEEYLRHLRQTTSAAADKYSGVISR